MKIILQLLKSRGDMLVETKQTPTSLALSLGLDTE